MVKVRSGTAKPEGFLKRKGFREDRSSRFMDARTGRGKNKKSTPTTVKAITFDPNARKEYILNMHKRKNERRATAQFQARQSHHKKTRANRAELREKARQQYNATMQVPIRPDFTLPLPTAGGDPDGSDDDADKSKDEGNKSYGGGSVVVTTESLNLSGDTEDMSPLVAQAVARALQERKAAHKRGEAQTKAQLNIQKELLRLRKVRTHSRKSKQKKHGKKKKKKSGGGGGKSGKK
eukprot:PhM_4_TR7195/c0_g1_i1/m.86587